MPEIADAGSAPESIVAAITGIHAEGGQIKDSQGQVLRLRGVNRSGTEYSCVQSSAIFDGLASEEAVQALQTWKINTVRIPLNESCWLGINGVPAAFSGENYRKAIKRYVNLLYKFKIVPILELHWIGPGTTLATRMQPLADADHAVQFWSDVATTFLDETGVILEPYNEPFPDNNRDSTAAWQCWKDGCTAQQYDDSQQVIGTYQAVGFQALVDAIRATGSTHLILLGGVQYSNSLSQWLAYKPDDPLNNLGAAWHIYNFNACASATCWDKAPATLATTHPILVTEFGGNDCTGGFATPLMQWLEQHGIGYLAWTWNTWGACEPPSATKRDGKPWALISDYLTATPNSGYALAVHDQFVQF